MKKFLHFQSYLQYGKPYIILLLIFAASQTLLSLNKILANEVTFESHVDNSENAILDNGLSATLNSYGGVIIGIGDYSGELELKFPSTVPANTTTYVRIDFDTDVMNMYVNNQLVYTMPYAFTLGAINFYSIDANNLYYVDDIFFGEVEEAECDPGEELIICDNFESYQLDSYMASNADHWDTWSSTPAPVAAPPACGLAAATRNCRTAP